MWGNAVEYSPTINQRRCVPNGGFGSCGCCDEFCNFLLVKENAEKYLARFDIDKETFEESLEEALADLVDEFFER